MSMLRFEHGIVLWAELMNRGIHLNGMGTLTYKTEVWVKDNDRKT